MAPGQLEYKNFRLIKTWENRVKLVSAVLKEEPERAYIFQILLNKRPEIKELLITVKNGEIDVAFEAASLPQASLLTVVDTILVNVAKKSISLDKKPLPGSPHHIDLLVGGMSCPACALLIEMALKKDDQIVDVRADLESKIVNVYGTLSKQEIIRRIEQLGYTHIGEPT